MSSVAYARVLRGWFVGCLAATATLDSYLSFIVVKDFGRIVQSVNIICFMVLLAIPSTIIATCISTALPAGLVIWFSETRGIRAVVFYAVAAGVIGVFICALIFGILAAVFPYAFTPTSEMVVWFRCLFGLAGCLAGIAYWSIAGKFAGAEDI